MAAQDIQTALPSTCKVSIPSPTSKPGDVVSRWSDTAVSLPQAVVIPTSISDVSATIAFAAENGLKVIPVVGAHASFVPINDKTICLSLTDASFVNLELEEATGEVKIGGGCLTGEVLKYLAEKGWYTTTVNSDAVGIVGALLGGSSGALNGLHGFGIDNLTSIDVIPFTPSKDGGKDGVLRLSKQSQGEEKKLWTVIRGAGHGMGVVTSVTMKCYRISKLELTNSRIWTRRLVFTGPTIETAAKLYTSLIPPPRALQPTLIFLKAPPTAPVPGAPTIVLALSYFGPAANAEEAAASSYEEEYTSKAVSVVEGGSDWKDLNTSSAPLNAHGGFKESYSAFCASLDSDSIVRAFEDWKKFASCETCGRSYVVMGAWDTTQAMKSAGEGLMAARDRGVFVQFTAWYADGGKKESADAAGKEIVDGVRTKDVGEGRGDVGFANNLVVGVGFKDIYTEEQIDEIRRVKGPWDSRGVGWTPVVDGW